MPVSLWNIRKMQVLQAWIVAGAYILLCTVGALTHNHVANVGSSGYSKAKCVAAGGTGSCLNPAVLYPAHCAYCDWQMSTVSPAIPVQHFDIPATDISKAPSEPLIQIVVSLPLTSSRAPPCV